jgi:hypothetical protein
VKMNKLRHCDSIHLLKTHQILESPKPNARGQGNYLFTTFSIHTVNNKEAPSSPD